MAEYIEREALIQQMADNFRQGVWDGCDCGEYQIAEETILCAPAADVVEVKHGRWINWGKSGTPTYENYGTCSVCHEDAEIHTEHRNYCPNCGAYMREVDHV